MRTIKLLIFSMCLHTACISQENLVLNSSFEDYTDLPKTSIGDELSFAKYWFVPTESSPDYYHTKSTFIPLRVPYTDLGYQPAHTGDAYIGFFPLNWGGYMEHYTGTLKKELKRGKVYQVSFFIRYAGSSCRFAIRGIGVRFSKSNKSKEIFKTDSPPFYYSILDTSIRASVQSNKDSILNDTAWVEICGKYKAKGGEKYITLGKFYDDKIKEKVLKQWIQLQLNKTKKEKFYKKHFDIFPTNPNYQKNSLFPFEASYYFIDDVSVIPLDKEEKDFTLP